MTMTAAPISPTETRPTSLSPQALRPSTAARPSMMRPSFMRPSTVRSLVKVFEETKLQNTNVSVFSSDVLMEGEMQKKGEHGLQTWKHRMFVLRGQSLVYYTKVEGERYGHQKGAMDVAGAKVDPLEGTSFSLTLTNGRTRILMAPCIQSLMNWLTALSFAATATVIEPTVDHALVDHSRTTHILLVRHGQYEMASSPSDDMAGPLTEMGLQQARATGAYLYEYLNERQVFKRFPKLPVYHSGMARTAQTAQTLTESFPNNEQSVELLENKLFREAWPGSPLPSTNRKMLPREKLDNMVSDRARVQIVYRTMFRHMIPDDLNREERPLSEEDKASFAEVFGATTQHRMNDRYRIIVCHANIIRWFICKALGVTPEGTWGRMRYNHCGITAMEIDSVGNVQIAGMNQTGHLPTAMITEN